MELSLPGLIGAVFGTLIGAINSVMLIGVVERSLRKHDRSQTAAERAAFESKIAILRRVVLGADILLLGGIGYWFGKTVGG